MGIVLRHPERDNSFVFEDNEQDLDMIEVFVSGCHLRIGDKAVFQVGNEIVVSPSLLNDVSPV